MSTQPWEISLLKMIDRAPDGDTYPLMVVQLRAQYEAIDAVLTELRNVREANEKNSAELHMMNAKEQAYLRHIKKLETALGDIYRATLPAGTVRASEVEHIAERHGVAEGLRER